MGAHFGLRLVEGADPATLFELAVPLFGTSSHAAQRVDEFALPWPCAWVFGHEGQGVAAGVAQRCRAMLAIPQPGGGESLNVAAAAAVCLYETARQHRR
jgi:TrmH family RNA methyltransferase